MIIEMEVSNYAMDGLVARSVKEAGAVLVDVYGGISNMPPDVLADYVALARVYAFYSLPDADDGC
jgi:hypothetical protein